MSEINKDQIIRNNGSITCDRSILASIIVLATSEVQGVARISTSSFRATVKKFFCRNFFEGVQIKFNSNGTLVVNVYIDIFFGYSVPEVAFRVQENVKSGVASMVEVKAARINVHVVNVVVQKEEPLKILPENQIGESK
ncbi:MAG: Asp23/Gls24 family envelope stress response protein [Clostridia bacterium]